MPLPPNQSPSSTLEFEIPDSPALLEKLGYYSPSAPSQSGLKAHSFLQSLTYAFEGLVYTAKTQRNFRIHLMMATVAIGLGSLLQINVMEWSMLWGIIGIVLFAELINTSIELLVDMITEGRFDLRAKAIKDTAAGAVLITAMSAMICGVCIFFPHIAKFLH